MKFVMLTISSLFLFGCTIPSEAIDPLGRNLSLNKIYQGNATWYSSGRYTANGERFDPNKLSVAHRTLPFGTILKLTNPENGNSIKAVVNDRGPFTKGKDIDVSRGGAEALGFHKKGTTRLHIEVIKQPH